MGTTIRRQPVNFDIPASPNYKFLNITNFRGLDVSSNPFELATNTASDCLNVYVDETNTLTTRPRLEKKINTPIDGDHIATYNLHNGYLLHYNKNVRDDDTNEVVGTQFEMRLLQDNKLNSKPVSGDVPTNECQYFEQGDNIYLLDGSRYLVLSTVDNNIKEVEGYVPILNTIDKSGNESSVEPLNLLSNFYRSIYFWDGEDVPYENKTVITGFSKNNAIKKSNFTTDLSAYEYVQQYVDDTCLLREITTGKLWYGVYTNNFSEIILFDTTIVTEKGSLITSAAHTKHIACVEQGVYSTSFFVYIGQNEWLKKASFLTPTTKVYMSGHGTAASIYHYSDGTRSNIDYYRFNVDSDEQLAVQTSRENSKAITPLFADNQETFYPLYWIEKADDKYYLMRKTDQYGSFDTLCTFDCGENAVHKMSSDGTIYYSYWTDDSSDVVYEYNLTTQSSNKTKYPKNFVSNFYGVSSEKNINYWVDNDNNLWWASRNTPDKYYDTLVDLNGIVLYNYELKTFITSGEQPFSLYFWNKDNPTIETCFEISPNDDLYTEWDARRKQLFKSTLYTRFDNNYWLASGNRYYRSANNDPTYFPITEYNDLGDSNEEITGFNLANDTTLIAYKKHRLYLIQPFTSSLDTTEYTITESKNTVGNTALGAPIVTTLTEIPLQINNDGVYGLSQLSNVSATERIADLMSEPINERWLNIDDKLITKAQTLNRLYWTYIILPDSAHEKTMIYLLDNRSNSWYYWELPIVVSNSFVKDNRAEFVDTAGNIYYLTTEDIINKAFETLITEYYDDGNKLIPWHWQSQILPLGTMNYSKRLVNTTFVLTDTDNIDGYGLNYSFKVFRKLASSTPEKEITGDLTLVRSTTKKTNISKFGFVQLRLSNITEESQGTEPEKAFRNNKLRLVGLGLKYVLLEGLIR